MINSYIAHYVHICSYVGILGIRYIYTKLKHVEISDYFIFFWFYKTIFIICKFISRNITSSIDVVHVFPKFRRPNKIPFLKNDWTEGYKRPWNTGLDLDIHKLALTSLADVQTIFYATFCKFIQFFILKRM